MLSNQNEITWKRKKRNEMKSKKKNSCNKVENLKFPFNFWIKIHTMTNTHFRK